MPCHRSLAVLVLLLVSACAQAPTQAPPNASGQNASGQNIAALTEAADTTRGSGRFNEAAELYQYVLMADPKSTAAQYGMAECLFALGKPGEAKRIFRELRGQPEYRGRAVQGLGLVELVQNDREGAAQDLREAVATDPKLWRAYNGLALLADLNHRPDEAAELYTKAMEGNPNSAVLYNNRGYSRLLAGKADLAVADFRKALELDAGSEIILNNLRIAIAARGDYREATKGVPREKLPVVMNNVGSVAMKRGDFAEAEAYLARAMTDSPNFETVAAQNLDRLTALKGDGR